MRIAILGAGGLGSLVGGYLAETGVDVTLIGRPAHVEAIRRDGLRIEGVRGEHVVRLDAVADPAEATGSFDHLMLAVKGRDTDAALAGAEALRDRVASVSSLQNSVTKDDRLTEWAGAERVIGAATIEGATLLEPGRVLNSVTVPATMWLGEHDGRSSARVEELAAALDRAGLPTRIADDIRQVQWEKLAQICVAASWSVTTLAALPELGIGDGLSVREGAEHWVALAHEAVAVLRSLGYEPQDFFAPLSRLRALSEVSFEEGVEMMQSLVRDAKIARGARTSMLEDVHRHRPTEVEDILRPIVDQAVAAGVATPTIRTSYRIIRTLDRHLAAAAAAAQNSGRPASGVEASA